MWRVTEKHEWGHSERESVFLPTVLPPPLQIINSLGLGGISVIRKGRYGIRDVCNFISPLRFVRLKFQKPPPNFQKDPQARKTNVKPQ